MNQIVNVAGYYFIEIEDSILLREALYQACKIYQVLGTILISHEGINFSLAGLEQSISNFIAELTQDPRFCDIHLKYSISEIMPFDKLVVKIKPEIISMGVPEIRPQDHLAPKISPETLKQWLDEGKEVILLDSRNRYEYQFGTFKDAIDIGIDHFRHFPEAVKKLPEELKSKPVVTFCTGGVRCEKSALLLQQEGFKEVYQLDGGLLYYFERCGGAHYEGECFVFDNRIAVDTNLNPTNTTQCYSCRGPVSSSVQHVCR